MKPILDLTKAISKKDYLARQFQNWGEDKNILFVNPQLSGKCLYKMILPFFSLYNQSIATAITGISKYDYEGQLLGGDEIEIDEKMIDWADFIVFPFTTQPLVIEFYERIRSLNREVKIVFLVDFNFYKLSDYHPFKNIFDEPSALAATEDNIWFADICLTSNAELTGVLVEKFQALGKEKYAETISYLAIACMPYMIDTEIVLKNIVEYDPMTPILVNPNEHDPKTKKHIDEVAEVAEVIKEANMAEKQKKLDELESDNLIEKEEEIPEPTFIQNEVDDTDKNKEKLTAAKNGSGKKYIKKHAEPKPTATAKSKKSSSKPTAKPKSTKRTAGRKKGK